MSGFERPLEYKLKFNNSSINEKKLPKVTHLWLCMHPWTSGGMSHIKVDMWLESLSYNGWEKQDIFHRVAIDLREEKNYDHIELSFMVEAMENGEISGKREQHVALLIFRDLVLVDEQFRKKIREYVPDWVDYAEDVLLES